MYYSSCIDTKNQAIATNQHHYQTQEYIRMAEKRTTANKYHNLRNHKCDTLKIVTDQNVYLAQNLDDK